MMALLVLEMKLVAWEISDYSSFVSKVREKMLLSLSKDI
jgi:hypothetical protein